MERAKRKKKGKWQKGSPDWDHVDWDWLGSVGLGHDGLDGFGSSPSCSSPQSARVKEESYIKEGPHLSAQSIQIILLLKFLWNILTITTYAERQLSKRSRYAWTSTKTNCGPECHFHSVIVPRADKKASLGNAIIIQYLMNLKWFAWDTQMDCMR